MDEFYSVYLLICPVDRKVRYVGVTRNDPMSRLKRHYRGVENKPKKQWLRELKAAGLSPGVCVLYDGLTKDEAEQKEIELISAYRSLEGNKLLNIADGGFVPPRFSPMFFRTYRNQHSEAMKKRRNIILQYNTTGEFLQEHIGVEEASRASGANERSIRRCYYGQRKTAGGYVWKLKEHSYGRENRFNRNFSKLK